MSPDAAETGPHAAALWPRWASVAGWGLVALGCVFLLWNFAQGRTLYVDEVNLARNFYEKDLAELVRRVPADPDAFDGREMQVAPLGFSLLVVACIRVLGVNEWSLRIIPTAAAVLALPLFLGLVRRYLRPFGGLVALALLVFGHHFLYYATQNKQYTTELLCTLAIVLLTLKVIDGRRRGVWLGLWSVAGAVAVWFAIPAVIVIAGSGLTLGVLALRVGDRRWVAALVGAGLAPVASFAVNYALVLRPQRHDPVLMAYMNDFWGHAFLTPSPKHLADKLLAVFENPVGLRFDGLAAALFALGLIQLVRSGAARFAVLLAPLAIAALMSFARQYPFADRLLIFALPALLVAVGGGIDFLTEGRHWRSATAAAVLAAAVLVFPVQNFGRVEGEDDLRSVLGPMEARFQPGDTIYVYGGAATVFRHYHDDRRAYEFPGAEIFYGVRALPASRWAEYGDDLARTFGRDRVWMVFTHTHSRDVFSEERLMTMFAERAGGKGIARVQGVDAAAYLYDLRDASAPTPQ